MRVELLVRFKKAFAALALVNDVISIQVTPEFASYINLVNFEEWNCVLDSSHGFLGA